MKDQVDPNESGVLNMNDVQLEGLDTGDEQSDVEMVDALEESTETAESMEESDLEEDSDELDQEQYEFWTLIQMIWDKQQAFSQRLQELEDELHRLKKKQSESDKQKEQIEDSPSCLQLTDAQEQQDTTTSSKEMNQIDKALPELRGGLENGVIDEVAWKTAGEEHAFQLTHH